MKILNHFWQTDLFICFLFFALQESNEIKIDVKIDVASSKNILLSLKILNNTKSYIKIPKHSRFGINTDPIADFIIEVQKYDSSWSNYLLHDERLPGIEKDDLIKISSKDSLIRKINIASFSEYNFSKGKYRARIIFMMLRFNKSQDLVSYWTPFNVDD